MPFPTFENVEILVDEQQITLGDLVEPQSQLLGVVGARFLGACGDLAGQAGVVPGIEQRSARPGQLLLGGQGGFLDVRRQSIEGALHQNLFRITKRGGHIGRPFT